MSRLGENRVSRTALIEMQSFVMSVICPDIPVLDEVEAGTPITMEHVAMLIQAIKDITGKDRQLDISTLMEMIFFP
ncbi:hypothetical protein [Corynebacterium sp. LK33]|uniref:hypothetical protein n=1 Tax=Corynebacterium sp. LK33 TaxID=2044574 RepID=UPI001651D78D|nr:hypothetical protein [Corynebacterium sp. LK33]MBC6821108.1 hypothetical protein [Corynebacterium sp. LK33]